MTAARAALRKLLAEATQGAAEVRVVSGDVMVWVERNGYGQALCDCGAEELPQAWADARLIAAAVNVLGPHLNQLDAAEREWDEARRTAEAWALYSGRVAGIAIGAGVPVADIPPTPNTTTGGNP